MHEAETQVTKYYLSAMVAAVWKSLSSVSQLEMMRFARTNRSSLFTVDSLQSSGLKEAVNGGLL